MRHLTDTLLATLIPLSILLHLSLSPYTKVEESFNIQATHDILTYGVPVTQAASRLREQYDHLTFTGPVPRTFAGPLVLAVVSWPGALLLEGVNRQILVRAILGLFNAFCLLSFRNGVLRVFGRSTANWFVVLQAGQFHLMYYASRTLPNFFAFGFTTLALRDLLPDSGGTFARPTSRQRYRRALTILTATGVIFRSEIALLLGTHTLYLLAFKRSTLSLVRDIIPSGLLGLLIGLSITVPLDSYFWLRFPLWPELSAFSYNILAGQSSSWGTSPWHFYLTSALPRLLFNPLVYQIYLPFTLAIPALRLPARDILIPNLAFVVLYSLQPHKEWRFIVYTIPPLIAVASAGAAWIWTRRAKSSAYRLLAFCLVASSLAAFAASAAMLAVSRLNYPGAKALEQLHELHALGNPHSARREVVRVHLDTLTCMTGVTRFLQLPPPPPLENGTWWLYDKSEDSTELLHPAFWDRVDYALAERVETVIGKWQLLGMVQGYSGVEIVRLSDKVGDDIVGVAKKQGGGGDGSVSVGMGDVWESLGGWARRWVTGGWWVRVRMEPQIRILRKQRSGGDG